MLNNKLKIKHKTIKNRLVMPPVVCFNWADYDGYETVSRETHYGLRAKGGAGVVVIEASAITREGRIALTELGIWEDGHISQFKRMADACHSANSIALIQLVHAGSKACVQPLYSASEQVGTCEAMSQDQIDAVIQQFVQAAIRAEKAGLDGVEIHGAHGYLINQFTASTTNKRDDAYGGTFQKRAKLALDIVQAVKEQVSEAFIIGYRFGVNDPTLKEDIALAKMLEQAGVDMLNVSAGIGFDGLKVPQGFNHDVITYMGVAIQPHVQIPVAAVCGIKQPEQAYDLVEKEGVALVAVGRGFLADPNWGIKAIAKEPVNLCMSCPGGCRFSYDGFECPWSKHW